MLTTTTKHIEDFFTNVRKYQTKYIFINNLFLRKIYLHTMTILLSKVQQVAFHLAFPRFVPQALGLKSIHKYGWSAVNIFGIPQNCYYMA